VYTTSILRGLKGEKGGQRKGRKSMWVTLTSILILYSVERGRKRERGLRKGGGKEVEKSSFLFTPALT